MYQPTRLNPLRFGLSRAFQRHHRNSASVTPGLHHLLPVPIRERLVILAKIDGASPQAIRQILPVSRDDANFQSEAMHQALELWRQTLDDAYWQVPVRSNWRHQREASVDKALRQLVWADVAVALIGDAALPEIVEALSLRRRLIAYSRVVEETTINQTVELFNASHWEVSEAIRIGLKATQGGI